MREFQDLTFILKNAWLIPTIPFVSFFIVGLLIRPLNERIAGWVATASVFASWVLTCRLALDYYSLFSTSADAYGIVPWSISWLRYQENFTVNLGVLLDPLSILLLIVVTTVSFLVHLYSLGYMSGESGFGRYFTFLNLFTFSMLGLVVAPNLIQIYMFWELVGVSSFLLIGFYYARPSAVAASKKAFIVTRFADLGFFVGILILGYFGFTFFNQTVLPDVAQPFDFLYLTHPNVLEKFSALPPAFFGMSVLSLAMILVFMGAAGKSALFPLHVWLPDAMEGPTPVSALIHAATMVVAGVYLVARLFPVFAAAPTSLEVVVITGAFTALFAAIIACTQDDIKRVLAFSTLSQLGYMMFALGVSSAAHPSGYSASLFHLFTHAFFKALLFLGAGSVIHAVHTNDVWEMGGLKRKMPITNLTFLIATLAISGVYPFSGFFSKDEILISTFESGHVWVFALGLFVASLTAFYMSRIYFLTFWGKARTDSAHHAHESPFVMLVPLLVLALLSASSGFLPFSTFVHLAPPTQGHTAWIPVLGSVASFIGIFLAIFLYASSHVRVQKMVERFLFFYTVIKRKFYIDEIYLFVTHKIIFKLIATPIAWFDRKVVDGGVNLSATLTRFSALSLRQLQTGQVQTYAIWLVGGVILVITFYWRF